MQGMSTTHHIRELHSTKNPMGNKNPQKYTAKPKKRTKGEAHGVPNARGPHLVT